MTSGPIVAGSIYLWDQAPSDGDWDKIPEEWKKYRFDACDFLVITPFVVTRPDYGFALGTRNNGQTKITKRLEWVIANARVQNPSIRFMASQWYITDADGYDYSILNSPDAINKHTDAVAAFLRDYAGKRFTADNGIEVSGRIDGYDVDFEGSTKQSNGPTIWGQIRDKIDAISRDPKFYISITPAWLHHLTGSNVATSLDFIFMQNYSGGDKTPPSQYLNEIPKLKPEQLVYGISSEEPWRGTVKSSFDDAVAAYATGYNGANFKGMWAWRLNSNNRVYENMVQVAMYNAVHGSKLPHSPDMSLVRQGWTTGGRADQVGVHDSVAPYTDWAWKE